MTDRSGFGPYADARLPAPVHHLGTDRDAGSGPRGASFGRKAFAYRSLRLAPRAQAVEHRRDAIEKGVARLDVVRVDITPGDRDAQRRA